MSSYVRLKIETRDRIGMTSDILTVFNRYRTNLKALEVEPEVISVKIDIDSAVDLTELIRELAAMQDVFRVTRINSMPQEFKEKYIEAVLNATGEGIVAVDKHGKITAFNHAAQRILNLKAQEVMGRYIGEVLGDHLPILKTIETGITYDHEEILLTKGEMRFHYITSGRPILDAGGTPVGAVASFKDMESVMQLVQSVTRSGLNTFDDILGCSEALLLVKKMAQAIAKSDSTVCIRGESGTGKELFARAIHMESMRKNRAFVPVNCGALPPALLESELFGYEEGAFTGAKKGGKQGLFQSADKGTIFLDEIADLPLQLQVKLLRVLQEQTVRQVGGREEIPIDVRVITATNKNLEEMVANGQFRQDLYYRLNVIPLLIPPLRDRREDVLILAQELMHKLAQKMHKKIRGITEDAMAKLLHHHWPGNVRELSNVLERGLTLCEDQLDEQHIILQEELSHTASRYGSSAKGYRRTLRQAAADAEKNAIKAALQEQGSIRKAATALGVTHGTILNKIKRYGLEKG